MELHSKQASHPASTEAYPRALLGDTTSDSDRDDGCLPSLVLETPSRSRAEDDFKSVQTTLSEFFLGESE